MTRSLVLLAHTFSYFDKDKVTGFSLEKLWNHSIKVAALAQKIAVYEHSDVDEAFLAGLLHDVGKLLLAVNRPEEYAGILKASHANGGPVWQEEIAQIGCTHAELGAELLATWNFPLSIVEAVALHHHPAQFFIQGFSPLTAAHAANALVHEFAGKSQSPLEMPYLSDLGLEERLEAWRFLATANMVTAGSNN
jgi:putative nucleotidyltransferase with HDIG domain